MPRRGPRSTTSSANGDKNTSGLVVNEYLPLNAVYLDFHNPSYEPIALLPAEFLYDILGYCNEVVVPLASVLPSLEPDYSYSTHLLHRVVSRDYSIKTRLPKSLESTVKLINSLVISRNW